MKTYVGFVWIGDDPGIRLRLEAESLTAASEAVDGTYGTGHVVSLWNEDDASRLR